MLKNKVKEYQLKDIFNYKLAKKFYKGKKYFELKLFSFNLFTFFINFIIYSQNDFLY